MEWSYLVFEMSLWHCARSNVIDQLGNSLNCLGKRKDSLSGLWWQTWKEVPAFKKCLRVKTDRSYNEQQKDCGQDRGVMDDLTPSDLQN